MKIIEEFTLDEVCDLIREAARNRLQGKIAGGDYLADVVINANGGSFSAVVRVRVWPDKPCKGTGDE